MAETVHLVTKYVDGMRFISRADAGASVVIDSGKRPPGGSGPTPVQLLLMALTGCTGMDVVMILNRMRVSFEGLEIEATGVRREQPPKRYTAVELVYRVYGRDIPRAKVERAVRLSLETYCSVYANLAPTLDLTTRVEVHDA